MATRSGVTYAAALANNPAPPPPVTTQPGTGSAAPAPGTDGNQTLAAPLAPPAISAWEERKLSLDVAKLIKEYDGRSEAPQLWVDQCVVDVCQYCLQ